MTTRLPQARLANLPRTQSERDQIMRDAFRRMTPELAQEIRDAYYKASEGLAALTNALEAANDPNPSAILLLTNECNVAGTALNLMLDSKLGRIL